ncbi:MAG: DUF2510 domain-containing protein [Acidimicrobiia bacterium]|nr:DUF2510 domain-containing protein [Acidimicrobiia bacterium]
MDDGHLLPQASQLPPGWSPDPTDPRWLCWWDGWTWTAHRAPAHPTTPTTADRRRERRWAINQEKDRRRAAKKAKRAAKAAEGEIALGFVNQHTRRPGRPHRRKRRGTRRSSPGGHLRHPTVRPSGLLPPRRAAGPARQALRRGQRRNDGLLGWRILSGPADASEGLAFGFWVASSLGALILVTSVLSVPLGLYRKA